MSMALEDTEVTPFPTASSPTYSDSSGTSASQSGKYSELQSELSGYAPGSFTEDSLAAMYPAYEIKVTYQYSDVYEEGVVMSTTVDATTGAINAIVSQGPKPST